MMFITHLVFGFLVALISITYFEVPNNFIFISIIVFSSIVADIDKMSSKIGSKVRPLSFLLELLFGHRGLMHTIYVPIAVFIVLSIFNYQLIGFAFLLGFISHLLIDSLNIKGISFLKPFHKFHISGFIKTGGILEYVLLTSILITIVLMVDVIF
ncbi:MAG: metal-dependent hydrolase [Candidatus Nanoarchaeia archaeon]|nr:metal-dependent hydrolase [Candidatus Nanoarchaeia archaeon]